MDYRVEIHDGGDGDGVEIRDGITFTIEATITGVAWTVQPLLFGAAQLGRHNALVWGLFDEVWEFPTLGLALDAMHELIRAAIAGEQPSSEWPAGWHRHRPGAGDDGWDRQGQAAQ
jgi:hypothetical protein